LPANLQFVNNLSHGQNAAGISAINGNNSVVFRFLRSKPHPSLTDRVTSVTVSQPCIPNRSAIWFSSRAPCRTLERVRREVMRTEGVERRAFSEDTCLCYSEECFVAAHASKVECVTCRLSNRRRETSQLHHISQSISSLSLEIEISRERVSSLTPQGGRFEKASTRPALDTSAATSAGRAASAKASILNPRTMTTASRYCCFDSTE
jgi:hypothetical protein